MGAHLDISKVPLQRTVNGIRFEKWYDEVRNLLDGKDEIAQRKALLANQEFCRGIGLPSSSGSSIVLDKAVSPSAVHVNQLLSTFSVMYANDEYIGLRLMPIVPVMKRSDVYAVYPKRERFNYPDDQLGLRSEANEIDASRTTDNYSVKDYGLSNYLDLETLQNEDAPLNEMLDLFEAINDGIAFKEEIRIATIVQASANYGGNTAAAATKWDTATTGGTIVADIVGADGALWRGRTPTKKIGVTTLDNWNTCIFNNPSLTDKIKYTQTGILSTQLVAAMFGLDDILIGRARSDTANSGQTASYSRIWSTDFFAILTVAARPTVRSLHFGSTFRLRNDPVSTEWIDPKVGKQGGIRAKVALSEDHKVVAGDAAFYISDVKT
jgi:hypothetical protein